MDTYNKVFDYIKKHNLIKKNDKIICAVSGGADSVCMLDLLNELKNELNIELYVAHLNHQLRGDEADRDENFVKELANHYGLQFHCKRVDVDALSTQLHLSCEEAGRFARYSFFNELKNEFGADKIATAHNKNDNVETVLMRLIRGTDIKGLSGIPVNNDISVIRPLLCIKRSEIEEYLKCKGVDFVNDSTNFEDVYSRNKIRNILIPEIKKNHNQSFIDVFSANIELFCEANNFIEKNVDNVYNRLICKDGNIFSFSVASLLEQDTYIVKRIIKKAVFDLCGQNISNDLCNLVYSKLFEKTSVTISKDLNFYIKYNRAFFVKSQVSDDFSYKITSTGIYDIPQIGATLEITEGTGNVDFSNKNIIYLDADKFSCDFILRNRQHADRMRLANCGSKKIKDIFIDAKIPVFMRDKYPILEYNGEIIWLCGIRDNTEFRAKENGKYIKITIHKENNHEQRS